MISGEKEDSISFPVDERICGSVFDTGGDDFKLASVEKNRSGFIAFGEHIS